MPHITLLADTPKRIEVRNIFCIGRNYAAHIAELGNRPEEDPVVFIKPTSALLNPGEQITLPSHSSDVHHEAELVLLIGTAGKNIDESKALSHIAGYGLGLDLTARDLQNINKKAGLPWAVAKGFDCSAVVSHFVVPDAVCTPQSIEFDMHLNGQAKQHGDIRKMLFPIPFVIAYLSRVFTLQAGDLIYTGTPEGVGPISPGDCIRLVLPELIDVQFTVK